jgi:DNA-binding NarL/FixJ family response regulator
MIRVFLADDHAIVRDGLRRLITETDGLALAGETSKGREALERAQQPDVDVLVLDLSLEDLGGLEVLRRLRELRPKLPVVVLSMYPEEQYAVRVLKMGAQAYLSKGRSSRELVEAIRTVADGRRYLTPGVADALLMNNSEKAPVERLSEREHQVFVLIAQGRTPGDIAAELNVSASTISSHLVHIREKLGVRTNGELVQYAYRSGLVAERG